jgi:hypothetical protein
MCKIHSQIPETTRLLDVNDSMHLQQQDWQQLHEGGPVFLDVDLV